MVVQINGGSGEAKNSRRKSSPDRLLSIVSMDEGSERISNYLVPRVIILYRLESR